jgi:hypothetical protein
VTECAKKDTEVLLKHKCPAIPSLYAVIFVITPDRPGRLVTLKILLEASTSKRLIEACNFEAYVPFLSYPEHRQQLGDPLQAKPPPEIRSLTAEERTWHWREIQLPLLCKCRSLLQTINCILPSPFPAGKPRPHHLPSICRIFYDPTSRNLIWISL